MKQKLEKLIKSEKTGIKSEKIVKKWQKIENSPERGIL